MPVPHAWTYATDGRLVGAPHMHEVEGFDKHAYTLIQPRAGINAAALPQHPLSAPPPLEEALAPLQGPFDRFQLATLARAKHIDYEVAANWKLISRTTTGLHLPTST